MRKLTLSLGLFILATTVAAQVQTVALRFVDTIHAGAHTFILDTRDATACQQRSLAGAHCLPARDLLGGKGNLPSFADIFWALGTAGLSGRETVLVVGDHAVARDFVAGVLYLSGQAKVEILRQSVADVLRAGSYRPGLGIPRAMLRQRIYHATMRDASLILPGELAQLTPRSLHVTVLNAGRYLDKTPRLTGLNQRHRHEVERTRLYVVSAAYVRDAMAVFTRLLARNRAAAPRIRVVPVAVHGNIDFQQHQQTRATLDLQQADARRGVKQWI